MSKSHAPEGFNSVCPYLIVDDVQKCIDFMVTVLDGVEVERVTRGESIGHAEVRIGDSLIMLGGAMEKYPAQTAMLYTYVADCDVTYQRALDAGAASQFPPADMFYGDRSSAVAFEGVTWWIATRKENLTTAEIQERANKCMK